MIDVQHTKNLGLSIILAQWYQVASGSVGMVLFRSNILSNEMCFVLHRM